MKNIKDKLIVYEKWKTTQVKFDDVLIKKMDQIFNYICEKFDFLIVDIKWNQLFFINENTFIVGFAFSKENILIAPEKDFIENNKEEIILNNYSFTNNLIRIPKKSELNMGFIESIINFQIKNKKNSKTFFKKYCKIIK